MGNVNHLDGVQFVGPTGRCQFVGRQHEPREFSKFQLMSDVTTVNRCTRRHGCRREWHVEIQQVLKSKELVKHNPLSLPHTKMNTVMARSSQEMSSKRHFHWTNKVGTEDGEVPSSESFSTLIQEEKKEDDKVVAPEGPAAPAATTHATRRKLQAVAVSRIRSVLTVFNKNRLNSSSGLGSRVVGTLFGYRRGHVHFAFQKDPTSQPAFLIELATPISGLVREMASGLVRIALECDKDKGAEKKPLRLLEEPVWRTYCNGKKSGFATRRDCGPKEWDILKAVEPISMGAGVLPGAEAGSEAEIMYMRAKFERIVGSRDSEAFYMMNPDSNGAPELSVYLLRYKKWGSRLSQEGGRIAFSFLLFRCNLRERSEGENTWLTARWQKGLFSPMQFKLNISSNRFRRFVHIFIRRLPHIRTFKAPPPFVLSLGYVLSWGLLEWPDQIVDFIKRFQFRMECNARPENFMEGLDKFFGRFLNALWQQGLQFETVQVLSPFVFGSCLCLSNLSSLNRLCSFIPPSLLLDASPPDETCQMWEADQYTTPQALIVREGTFTFLQMVVVSFLMVKQSV
ncbi:Protein MIZU-KUSSEI 1, partial [Mucuna pruriens]